MSNLIVMVGLPGSGKDTWIKDFLNSEKGQNYKVLSTDDILVDFAKVNGISYNDAFNLFMKDAEKEFNRRVREYSDEGYNVIWNQTNMGVKKRKKILNAFHDYTERDCVVITINTNVLSDRLDRRAESEGKYISPSVIANMNSNYSEPSMDEGFNSILILDNSGSEFSLVKYSNSN